MYFFMNKEIEKKNVSLHSSLLLAEKFAKVFL